MWTIQIYVLKLDFHVEIVVIIPKHRTDKNYYINTYFAYAQETVCSHKLFWNLNFSYIREFEYDKLSKCDGMS